MGLGMDKGAQRDRVVGCVAAAIGGRQDMPVFLLADLPSARDVR